MAEILPIRRKTLYDQLINHKRILKAVVVDMNLQVLKE